ncbi:hypothetical protein [Thiomicrospira microaerophila]|uniref:hypothetical protein n=1 Tax=Thiomicrospira microaerophila TaxID=406020 RepID=UPI0005C91185|nr:hypothetical protein [Thiomicrospira microaerophila]
MIFHKDELTLLDQKRSFAFVGANAALEGHRLSFSDKRGAWKVILGKQKADDLIESIMLQNGLRRRSSSLSTR